MVKRALQIGTVLSLTMTAWLIARALGAPYLGFYYYLEPQILAVDPGSPAERAGLGVDDRIVSIDGTPVSGTFDLVTLTRRAQVGEPLAMSVSWGGVARDLTLVPARYFGGLHRWAGCGAAVLFWLLSLWPYRRKPDFPPAQIYYATGLAVLPAVTMLTLIGRLYNQVPLITWWILPVALIPALSLHLTLSFPRPHPFFKDSPGRFALLYAPGLAYFAYFMVRVYALWGEAVEDPSGAAAYFSEAARSVLVFMAMAFAAWALAVLVVFRAFRRTPPGIERRQMKWLFWGGTIPLLLGLAIAYDVLTQRALISSGAYSPWAMAPGVVGVGLAWALALVEYRLPDVDRFLARSLSYGIASLITVGYFVVLVWIFRALFRPSTEMAAIVATVIVAVLFSPLVGRLQSFVDEQILRSAIDLEEARERLSARLMQPGEAGPLVRKITQDIGELWQAEPVQILLRTPQEGFALFPQEDTGERINLGASAPLVRYLARVREPLQAWRAGGQRGGSEPGLRRAASANLAERSLCLAIPLFEGPSELLAILLLGAKRSGDLYSSGEITWMNSMAPQWALAIRNAMAYEEIAALTQRQEELLAERTADLAQAQQTIRLLRGIRHEPYRGLCVGEPPPAGLRARLEAWFNLESARTPGPGYDFYLYPTVQMDSLGAGGPATLRLGWDEHSDPAELLWRIYRARVTAARHPIDPRHAVIAGQGAMSDLIDYVRGRVGPLAESVLIQGESGTGKELIARLVHASSPRAAGPFVAVNVGALASGVIESELFGHEKGAFTGAVQARVGKFELANQGTIFLDEIGELSPELQVKLLRVLQEREVDPVGGTRPRPVDARIVAATNRDLRKMVEEGKFREDFYYRIHVIPVDLPPLRERTADIRLLVVDALDTFNRENSRSILPPDRRALARYENHSWPGNVRELFSWVTRVASQQPDGTALPFETEGAGASGAADPSIAAHLPEYQQAVDHYARRIIEAALERSEGNVKEASRLLKMNYHKLRREIARLEPSEEPEGTNKPGDG